MSMQMYKEFATKGVEAYMEMELPALRKKIDKLRDDDKSAEFVARLEAAEKKAKEIGEKWLKRVQEKPLHFFPGYDFSHWDLMSNGGYRFWFKPATEPNYSI